MICDSASNFGTAFLVIWRNCLFILTNNHVIPSKAAARRSVLEFRAVKPPVRIKLDPAVLFHTNTEKELDFTLVAIARESLSALVRIQPLELSNKYIPTEEKVQLVGYPKGSSFILDFICSWYDSSYHCIFNLIGSAGMSVLRKSVGTWLASSSGESVDAISFFLRIQQVPDTLIDKFVVYEVETGKLNESRNRN